jgi:hypothetical protein
MNKTFLYLFVSVAALACLAIFLFSPPSPDSRLRPLSESHTAVKQLIIELGEGSIQADFLRDPGDDDSTMLTAPKKARLMSKLANAQFGQVQNRSPIGGWDIQLRGDKASMFLHHAGFAQLSSNGAKKMCFLESTELVQIAKAWSQNPGSSRTMNALLREKLDPPMSTPASNPQ